MHLTVPLHAPCLGNSKIDSPDNNSTPSSTLGCWLLPNPPQQKKRCVLVGTGSFVQSWMIPVGRVVRRWVYIRSSWQCSASHRSCACKCYRGTVSGSVGVVWLASCDEHGGIAWRRLDADEPGRIAPIFWAAGVFHWQFHLRPGRLVAPFEPSPLLYGWNSIPLHRFIICLSLKGTLTWTTSQWLIFEATSLFTRLPTLPCS